MRGSGSGPSEARTFLSRNIGASGVGLPILLLYYTSRYTSHARARTTDNNPSRNAYRKLWEALHHLHRHLLRSCLRAGEEWFRTIIYTTLGEMLLLGVGVRSAHRVDCITANRARARSGQARQLREARRRADPRAQETARKPAALSRRGVHSGRRRSAAPACRRSGLGGSRAKGGEW
jgi:hypothetical protein